MHCSNVNPATLYIIFYTSGSTSSPSVQRSVHRFHFRQTQPHSAYETLALRLIRFDPEQWGAQTRNSQPKRNMLRLYIPAITHRICTLFTAYCLLLTVFLSTDYTDLHRLCWRFVFYVLRFAMPIRVRKLVTSNPQLTAHTSPFETQHVTSLHSCYNPSGSHTRHLSLVTCHF